MKKKLYNSPLTEVVTMEGTCNIMKTSIDLLSDPVGAPRRWKEPVQLTPVF